MSYWDESTTRSIIGSVSVSAGVSGVASPGSSVNSNRRQLLPGLADEVDVR